jgi:hypothetical protein
VSTLKRHLSVANVLSMVAIFIALSATAVAATKLGPGQVKEVNIANQAVSNLKLKNLGVTSSKIANGTIVTGKLKGSSVVAGKLGKEAVTAGKIKKKAVGTAALAPESVTPAKISSTLSTQLLKNPTYVTSSSVTNNEPNKTATASCPAGKQAISGGIRLEGELAGVATTASYPFFNGSVHSGWTAIAHETGGPVFNDWSIVAFAVCAEL